MDRDACRDDRLGVLDPDGRGVHPVLPACPLRLRHVRLHHRELRSFFVGRDAAAPNSETPGLADITALREEMEALRRELQRGHG